MIIDKYTWRAAVFILWLPVTMCIYGGGAFLLPRELGMCWLAAGFVLAIGLGINDKARDLRKRERRKP